MKKSVFNPRERAKLTLNLPISSKSLYKKFIQIAKFLNIGDYNGKIIFGNKTEIWEHYFKHRAEETLETAVP